MAPARRPTPRPVATAIVTGAGSRDGIGFAIARRLGLGGLAVELIATSDRIHDRATELRAVGCRAIGHSADLRDETAVAEMVATVVSGGGRVDVLVNNAGMTSQGAGADSARLLDRLTLAEWDDTMQRNLSTAFLVCRAVVPAMRRRRYGRIINIASTTGPVSAFERASAYAAAKAGMVGMTRALSLEVARYGITVNAVAPGWIDTASATPAERRAGAASPVGRSGTADEVAAAVEFLASRSASYITGTLMVVDGGNAVIEDKARG